MSTRYTIDDIAPLLALRERDGLSLAELSRRSGIKADTLRRWERRFADDEGGGFARVHVAPDLAPKASHSTLRITIGAAVIEFGGGADRATLELAVDVLLDRC